MRTLFLGSCLLLICLHMNQVKGMGSRRAVPPVPAPVEIPVPSTGEFLHIKKCTNCSEAQWKFIQEAQIKTNETVKSTCFASFMLERKLKETGLKSNQEVIDSLKGVVVDVEMYYTLKRVLGYTYPDVQKIWINRRYMMKWNRCDLGSLLGHESSHKVGYGHDFKATPGREFTVPYSMNAAIDKCCVR